MKITIVINTDNESFQDGNLTNEAGNILDIAMSRLDVDKNKGFSEFSLFDSNGNCVGHLTWE